MRALLLSLAFVFCLSGQLHAAPAYTLAGIVAAANGAPGPFAPNSILIVRGTGLAFSERALTPADIAGGSLPYSLNGVQVKIDGVGDAPLFYVSPTQVNFLLPPNALATELTVWVVLQGVNGPKVKISIAETAPALFPNSATPEYAIAQNWPEYALITPGARVAKGAIVILYAVGLGHTDHSPTRPEEIPVYAGWIDRINDFRIYLDGKPLNSSSVLYAGIAPGWCGLYQINFFLPYDVGTDPEIRLAVGDRLSAAGLKLAVR